METLTEGNGSITKATNAGKATLLSLRKFKTSELLCDTRQVQRVVTEPTR